MEPLIVPLLVVTVLGFIVVIALQILTWSMHNALASKHSLLDTRVAALEAQQENALTHLEIRNLYAELAEIKGRLATATDLMRNVQEYLLEKEQ